MRAQGKCVFLAILISLLVSTLTMAQHGSTASTQVYKQISGSYDFFINQKHHTFRVFIGEDGALYAEGFWSARQRLITDSTDSLAFTIDMPDAHIGLKFAAGEDGVVKSCTLIGSHATFEGTRITKPESMRKFSREELLADLQQLREALETNHPGMYDFVDEAAFNERYQTAADSIRGTMAIEDFLKLSVPLVNDMGCGHSAMIPPAAYFQNAPGKFCPLQIRVLGGKMYLLRIFGDKSPIPPGSEIVSINGEPSTDILEKLMPYIPADANLKTTKLYKLEGFFYDAYTLLYDFPEKYDVVFIRPEGKADEMVTLEAVAPVAIMMALGPERQKMFNLEFKILDDGTTALMDINSFAFYQNEEKFKSYIDESFMQIKDGKIASLIIDLRRNEGGDPYCAAHLLSYLISSPVSYYPADYPEYKPLTQPIQPAENNFCGSLYILTDAGCFSSTNHLCALLKYHGIGTFVGTETGGTYTCNSGIRGIELNNTHIRVGVATRRASVVVKGLPKDRGILPDHIVESKQGDIANETDVVLDAALELIRAKQ